MNPRAVGAGVDRAPAELQLVLAAGDLLVHRLVGIERLARLVDVGHLHRRADGQRARVGRLLARDHAEERRLARAVGADDADDAAAREGELEILEEEPVAVSLGDLAGDDDFVAEALGHRDHDFGRAFGLPLRLLPQLFVPRDARLALGLAGARRQADPLELALQRLLPGGRLLLLLGQAALLLVEPRRVVALPGNAGALVELEDPAGDVVEEVAIVRDGDDGAGKFREIALEPPDALGVEVVGRLVEQQHVGLLEQHAAERHAPPLAAGQPARRRHRPAGSRSASIAMSILWSSSQRPRASIRSWRLPCFSRRRVISSSSIGSAKPGADLLELGEQRALVGHRHLDVAADVLGGVELRLLWQVADPGAGQRARVAEKIVVHPGHDPEQRRFPGAVRPQHADLGAGVEGEVDAFEDLAGRGARPSGGRAS